MKRRTKILIGIWLTGLAVLGAGAATTMADSDDSGEGALIDINRADTDELMELPGVGEIVAKRIVAYREKNGSFRKKEELMNVRGIGEKTYLKLEPLFTVGQDETKDR